MIQRIYYLNVNSCPKGSYTFGKTGQTTCRTYNYFKPKMFTIEQTEDKYATLLDSIDKNKDKLRSLDDVDKTIQNLNYTFK